MDHQKQIASQRIDNLHSGISKASELVDNVRKTFNHENLDIKQVQKELEEIEDFLAWLSNQ